MTTRPESFPAFATAYRAEKEFNENLEVPDEIALWLATEGIAAANLVKPGSTPAEDVTDTVVRLLRDTLIDDEGDHRWSHRWRYEAFHTRVWDLVYEDALS